MIWLINWLVLSIIVAWIADSRGNSGTSAFFLSFLLSPPIGLIIVLCTDRKKMNTAELAHIAALRAAMQPQAPAPYRAVRKPVDVAKAGENLGKLSVREIERRVRDGELDAIDDHFYDEESGEWQPLGVLVDA
jgi:hypothetical protein